MLERLTILANTGEPMETDATVTGRDKAIAGVVDRVASVVDYTLSKLTILLLITVVYFNIFIIFQFILIKRW